VLLDLAVQIVDNLLEGKVLLASEDAVCRALNVNFCVGCCPSGLLPPATSMSADLTNLSA
jgi:hypothetical protein